MKAFSFLRAKLLKGLILGTFGKPVPEAVNTVMNSPELPLLSSQDLASALYKTYVNRSTLRALRKQARRKSLHPNAPRGSQNYRPGPGMPAVLKDFLSRAAQAHGYTL